MFTLLTKLLQPRNPFLDDLVGEDLGVYWYNYELRSSPAGRRLLEATPEEQLAFVVAAARWLDSHRGLYSDKGPWLVRMAMLALLRRRLPLGVGDVLALLNWSRRLEDNSLRSLPQMIKTVEDYLRGDELTPELSDGLGRLIKVVEAGRCNAETRKSLIRLRELAGVAAERLPLSAGEAWADAAAADISAAPETERAAWVELLNVCAKASGSAPTTRWLKSAAASMEKLGRENFREAVLKWFPLVDRPRTRRIASWAQWQPDPNLLIEESSADILRGLVWACAEEEDGELARALRALAVSTYRKVPSLGPRCVRVGNACAWALGRMPGTAGVGQLALLKVKVKFGTAQKVIEASLAEAAKRAGLPRDEVEEMSVPTYGLQEVGLRRERLGEYAAELVVTGTNSAELKWVRPDGKRQASVPQALKEQHAVELKELTQAVKDIRKMLPAQAERIDNLYLEQRSWALAAWRERYLEHPLVGTLARRLIWKFTGEGHAASGSWHEGRLVGSDGAALDWPDDSTRVELWHPIHEPTEVVLGWREWLAVHEVRQPFKQAHREVYVLTDAERATRVYSNRFAAHVIRQHQFNALCAARGWRNKLRLMVDDEFPPATRALPKLNLRAEFWIDAVGDNYGTDTNEAGTYLYLTTDQVRFYPMGAPQHFAHGGGYHAGYYAGGGPAAAPIELEQIDPLVFSEVMRDVDMFVGVASVANDPNWADGGPEVRYHEYWHSYSFGDLSETAKTRRQVLERLVPRLKIAERCHLTDRFLVVRGDVRTYKIHLGSGNILMEPNDQYLCIVPARGGAAAGGEGAAGKVFLPFEGDNTLAIILSKAFMLADDLNIKDSTILRQLKL